MQRPTRPIASDLTILGTAAHDPIAAIGRAGIVARSPMRRVVRSDLVAAPQTIVARTTRQEIGAGVREPDTEAEHVADGGVQEA